MFGSWCVLMSKKKKRSTNAAASHHNSLGARQLCCGGLRTLPTVKGTLKSPKFKYPKPHSYIYYIYIGL